MYLACLLILSKLNSSYVRMGWLEATGWETDGWKKKGQLRAEGFGEVKRVRMGYIAECAEVDPSASPKRSCLTLGEKFRLISLALKKSVSCYGCCTEISVYTGFISVYKCLYRFSTGGNSFSPFR